MTSTSISDARPAAPRPAATRLVLIAEAAPASAGVVTFAGRDTGADPAALRKIARRGVGVPRADRIWRSPARAAGETAEALGLAAFVAPDLRDRDHGAWTGQSLQALAEQQPEALAAWLCDPDAAPPGGESVAALMGRLAPWLDGQCAAGGTIVALAHPATIRACLVLAIGAVPDAWFRIDVGHGSRSLLTHAGSFWRVGLVNAPL